MNNLNPTELDAIMAEGRVAVPSYDRSALRPAIVHLGVGGFHRAHLATYVDDLARTGNTDWAIHGVGILPGDEAMARALEAQDCLYTLVSRGTEQTEAQVIGSIVNYLHAYPDRQPLLDLIAAPTTRIVSMTVTEGGYPIDDTTGNYSPTSANAGANNTFGLIARGLEQRRAQGGGPLTIISCDNILSNGSAARASTLGEAVRISPELSTWIETNVAFPNSMVDRITPATTDADRQWVADRYNLVDRWPVMAEPFRQWVIEDRFAGDRLPLEDLDVIVTADVEPYEHMKLRLLNAGHSSLCYLAALAGYKLVDQAMADPYLGAYERALLEREARPVVEPVEGIDLDTYVDSLMERFANPSIGDQISRLCLDGSAKFPKFLVPTIEAQLAIQGPVDLAAMALAGWCEYLNGVDELGNPITLSADPRLDEAVDYANQSRLDPVAFLGFDAVFSTIGSDPRFQKAFIQALNSLRTTGVATSLEQCINS